MAFKQHEPVASAEVQSKIHFDAADEGRPRIHISLKKVGEGFELPTDIQFIPGETKTALVAEKNGRLSWWNAVSGERKTVLKVNVETASEQGLLGIAFHPTFEKNKKLYLNYVVKEKGQDVTRVAEFEWASLDSKAKFRRTILDVAQPYGNHNAGQLAFGPDGYLYIGYGDGGWANDPEGNGQNRQTFLGSMIRIDIDKKDPGKEYAIPKDNPFVQSQETLPEIWAVGLRNPWRYHFDSKGYLIVADVGQNKWEEVSVVEKGGNYGWAIMEGHRCFQAKTCHKKNLKMPMLVYGREDGGSITGGYVYEQSDIPSLKDHYIFADFVSQRVWAAERPDPNNLHAAHTQMKALGNWDMSIATFGQDAEGTIYAADFNRGDLYQITAAP